MDDSRIEEIKIKDDVKLRKYTNSRGFFQHNKGQRF